MFCILNHGWVMMGNIKDRHGGGTGIGWSRSTIPPHGGQRFPNGRGHIDWAIHHRLGGLRYSTIGNGVCSNKGHLDQSSDLATLCIIANNL